MILVTGAGRSGTSLLMAIFTFLGLDTGFDEKEFERVQSSKEIEMTGKGGAERILATVMQIMEKFLEHSTPDEIVFIAPTDSPARARVYEKMVGRYAKRFKYELVNTHKKPDEIWFTLSHEQNVF